MIFSFFKWEKQVQRIKNIKFSTAGITSPVKHSSNLLNTTNTKLVMNVCVCVCMHLGYKILMNTFEEVRFCDL